MVTRRRILAALGLVLASGVGALWITGVLPPPWRLDDEVCLRHLERGDPLRWLHNASDLAIFAAYMSMPVTLLVIRRARLRAGREVPYGWLVALFAAFIALCGCTHFMGFTTTWKALYWLDGYVKAPTGLVSIITAIALVWLRPALVELPSAKDYQTLVGQLRAALGTAEAEGRAANLAAAHLKEKLAVIARQKEAIEQLEAPILRVDNGTLLMPLIGVIHSERAQSATERLLYAVQSDRARHVVLDLTGVQDVDTATANHLAKMIKTLELLGARTFISGIQSRVAWTLVELGVDMRGMITVPDVEEALERCRLAKR